jgi:hypothetical protein
MVMLPLIELFSLLREPVDMRVIEVSEKTLPQISTVFQGLRGIVYEKGRNSPQESFGKDQKQ